MRRADLGLTQQHRTSVATLERLAEALEVRFVMGFETGPGDAPVRDLVSV